MTRDRSSFSAVCLLVCLAWAASAWLMPHPPVHVLGLAWEPSALWHKVASVVLATGLAIHLFLAVTFERTD